MSALKRKIHIGFLIISLTSGIITSAQAPGAPENEVKAVFILNLTQFIEWPPSTFSSDKAPLIIGVLGDNPFGSYLDAAVAGEHAHGHPLTVSYYKSPEEAATCQVLFITSAKLNEMEKIPPALNGKSILTISDAPNFMQAGGMVRLYNKNNKINIQVNLDAAKTAKLDVSSKLLRLCDIYAP
jgi:hypothetical protein